MCKKHPLPKCHVLEQIRVLAAHSRVRQCKGFELSLVQLMSLKQAGAIPHKQVSVIPLTCMLTYLNIWSVTIFSRLDVAKI